MANEAEPFFYRDPAGREDIFSTGGRRKMNKKGKKKGAALLLLFLSKVSHLFFSLPQSVQRKRNAQLFQTWDLLVMTPYGKKKGSIHIVCYFIFFLFRSYPFGGNASFDKREKRDGGVV